MNSTTSVMRDPVDVAIAKNALTVVFSAAIIYVNSALVHTFTKHQVFFTNPRYILYIHLVLNDIIMLILFVVLQVTSYVYFSLNVALCITLLIAAISTNLNNPVTLAAMAVECYLAICFPLHYPRVCTVRKTYAVIGVIWFLGLLTLLPDLFVLLATRPPSYFQTAVFCTWELIFTAPHLAKKKEVTNILFLVIVWLVLFYTYFRILFAAQSASANAKKARSTVLLHGFQLLLCMLSYLHSISIQALSWLFPKDTLLIRYLIAILIQILPRLISPMVYGLRDKMFREYLRKTLYPARKIGTRQDKAPKRRG